LPSTGTCRHGPVYYTGQYTTRNILCQPSAAHPDRCLPSVLHVLSRSHGSVAETHSPCPRSRRFPLPQSIHTLGQASGLVSYRLGRDGIVDLAAGALAAGDQAGEPVRLAWRHLRCVRQGHVKVVQPLTEACCAWDRRAPARQLPRWSVVIPGDSPVPRITAAGC